MLFHHIASNANIKLMERVIEHKFICKFIFSTMLMKNPHMALADPKGNAAGTRPPNDLNFFILTSKFY